MTDYIETSISTKKLERGRRMEPFPGLTTKRVTTRSHQRGFRKCTKYPSIS